MTMRTIRWSVVPAVEAHHSPITRREELARGKCLYGGEVSQSTAGRIYKTIRSHDRIDRVADCKDVNADWIEPIEIHSDDPPCVFEYGCAPAALEGVVD